MGKRWMEDIPVIKQIIGLNKEMKGLQRRIDSSQEEIEGLREEINLLRQRDRQMAQLLETEQQRNKNLNDILEKYETELQELANKEKADKEELRIFIQNAKTEARKNLSDAKYEIGKQMQYNLIKSLSPEQYKEALCEWYYGYTGERLDLENPRTFNQKIQWMKLYDNTPLKTKLADKYEVREWVKETIGEEYLIPLLGVWDSFDEIDFDALPNQFVLKANHGCGWNIIVKNKEEFNREEARKKFFTWLGRNYVYEGFELHYKGIRPKIIAEQYIENDNDLYDYKFFCLNEKPQYVWVDTQRYSDHRRNIYDMQWKEQPFQVGYQLLKHSDTIIPKPEDFEKMKELAAKLCNGFPLVRVDLYNINGRIYFGEMTFTPANGKAKFEPKEYDAILGDMVTLPEKKTFEGKML